MEKYPTIINWLLLFLGFLLIVIVGFVINARVKNRLLKEQTIDSLTNLPNRTKLRHHINSMNDPGLAIIDINNFKLINDLYGFETGDEILISFSKQLSLNLDSRYQLYRLGNDQFGILADISISPESFDLSIETLLKKIKNSSYHIDNLDVQLTLTAGISRYDSEYIIQMAEMALQKAKQKNEELCIIDPTLLDDKPFQDNILWAHKLSTALNEHRIVPFYQAIIDNRTGTTDKYEALVRLIDEDGGIISPSFFLEAAKNTRQYAALTEVMIEKSFMAIKKYQACISINFTVEDIRNDKTITFFKTKVKELNIADNVIIELTESEGIENYQEVSRFISDIKKLGCRIAIDDFGTGYSNFTHLIHLNVDYLKIDGSIISKILIDTNAEIVAKTLVDFAKRLDIETIAEFVETREIYEKVKEIGIHYSQGYFIARPERELSEVGKQK